jgi:hypothetical protein
MGRKDKVTQVTTAGSMRVNDRGLRCRSCGGTTGWQSTTRDGRTVIVHACGAVQ